MGEFLLSFLGFGSNGTIVYTRRLKGSHYEVGDPVPFVYPNQHRKTKRAYLRILEKFYEPELIAKLIETQDPNVIDQNGFVPYQRQLQDEDIYNLLFKSGNQHSFLQVGIMYGWHRKAVEAAAHRHKDRLEKAKRDAVDIQDTEPLTPTKLTQSQQVRINSLLSQWE